MNIQYNQVAYNIVSYKLYRSFHKNCVRSNQMCCSGMADVWQSSCIQVKLLAVFLVRLPAGAAVQQVCSTVNCPGSRTEKSSEFDPWVCIVLA